MRKRFLILLVACLLVVGCEDIIKRITKQPQSQGEKPVIKGSLLAQVNDWAIGTADFRESLEALKVLLPQGEAQQNLEDLDTKKKVLQELVNREILSQVAREKGMANDKEVVKTIKEFERNLLAEKILLDLYKDINVTDVEVEDFYKNNKLIFTKPEERKIREIVVSSETQAKDILIRSLQGEDFSALARTYSIAETKTKGGDLGYLKIDRETTTKEKFPKFWQEALTTDKGNISNYFKGPQDYYILKVEDIRGGEAQELREVREDIKEHLRGQKLERKKEDIIYDAQQKFKITINENLLN